MPTCVFIRGIPGTGKNTVSKLLERELQWPRIWVHSFDEIYKAIGNYKCPDLTDRLIRDVSAYMMQQKRDFLIVRPSRTTWGMECIAREARYNGYKFVAVKLMASYDTMLARVANRPNESPFRLTTKEALDEYLSSRKEEAFAGEVVIETDGVTAEGVAARVKELL